MNHPNNTGNSFLDEYVKPRGGKTKLWITLAMLAAFAALIWMFKTSVIEKSMDGEELKSAIEFFDISSRWVVKEKVDTPDFKGVIIVPEISFRVRNQGKRELGDVFLLGVFSFMDTGKTIGEGYEMVLKKSIDPGEESNAIVLTSGFGYRASSVQAFEKNRRNWRRSYVEIFAKSGHSKLTFIKSFYVSQIIKGMSIDVHI